MEIAERIPAKVYQHDEYIGTIIAVIYTTPGMEIPDSMWQTVGSRDN